MEHTDFDKGLGETSQMNEKNISQDIRRNYKRMFFYQIWVRSFCAGNGDGIGDLYGVYDKLEYIRSLGVDAIWLCPVYPSPNADYGYDISDYKNIHPDFGDLAQFKKVLDRAHELGMKVIMDLVINHTSDEHPWFLMSREGKDNPYSDYYIWRDRPNNWKSILEGEAWEYDESRGQYYLHLFAKKQPDLKEKREFKHKGGKVVSAKESSKEGDGRWFSYTNKYKYDKHGNMVGSSLSLTYGKNGTATKQSFTGGSTTFKYKKVKVSASMADKVRAQQWALVNEWDFSGALGIDYILR